MNFQEDRNQQNQTSKNNIENDQLGKKIEIARKFEETAKINYVYKANTGSTPEAWNSINRKEYPRFPKISLNETETETEQNSIFLEVLNKRQSCRSFTSEPISIKKITMLLKTVAQTRDREIPKKIYPSAGMRWPIEWYLAAINVSSLSSGIYHYESFTNSLELLQEGDPWPSLSQAFVMQEINCPAAVLILTSAFYRTWIKYGARGSRFAHMEAGAAAMCLDLIATEANLGVVWIGGFVDSIIFELLDLHWDMELEAPILCIALGYPK